MKQTWKDCSAAR